jgi:hypothetical protein
VQRGCAWQTCAAALAPCSSVVLVQLGSSTAARLSVAVRQGRGRQQQGRTQPASNAGGWAACAQHASAYSGGGMRAQPGGWVG